MTTAILFILAIFFIVVVLMLLLALRKQRGMTETENKHAEASLMAAKNRQEKLTQAREILEDRAKDLNRRS